MKKEKKMIVLKLLKVKYSKLLLYLIWQFQTLREHNTKTRIEADRSYTFWIILLIVYELLDSTKYF